MKNGWQRKQIGDLCEVVAGQSPEGKFYNTDGTGMPFYQGKKDFGEKFIEDPTTWTTQTTKIAREGDILMSVRAPVGPVNFATDEVCIGRGLAAIRSKAELNRDFLFYQLLHLQPEIAGREGAVFASINKSEIEALPIAFAPLPEQQRIVGILDEAFQGIATAKANAEKNLQNARALFQSYLQSVFTRRGPGWVNAKLGDVCQKITDGTHITPTYTKEGIPFLSVKNLTQGFIDFSETRFISVAEHEFLTRRCKAVRDDILYTKVGTTGIAQVVDVDDEFSIFVSVALLKPKHDVVFNLYLEHFLNAPYAREQAQKRTRGMANRNLVITDIKEINVHFPKSLEEQRTIVANLESLSTETQRLASIYERKLGALEALKKSLLHQAFTGEL